MAYARLHTVLSPVLCRNRARAGPSIDHESTPLGEPEQPPWFRSEFRLGPQTAGTKSAIMVGSGSPFGGSRMYRAWEVGVQLPWSESLGVRLVVHHAQVGTCGRTLHNSWTWQLSWSPHPVSSPPLPAEGGSDQLADTAAAGSCGCWMVARGADEDIRRWMAELVGLFLGRGEGKGGQLPPRVCRWSTGATEGLLTGGGDPTLGSVKGLVGYVWVNQWGRVCALGSGRTLEGSVRMNRPPSPGAYTSPRVPQPTIPLLGRVSRKPES